MMTCLEGLGMDVTAVRQSDLYQLARGTNGEDQLYWHSAPDLLVGAMNQRWPGMPKQVEYVLAVTQVPRELDLAMAAGIELLNAPSIALVQGGGHWISVTGYCAENEVISPTDTDGRVIAMESINCGRPLNEEQAPDEVAPPIQHGGKDKCGKGTQEPMVSFTPLLDWESQDGWMSRVNVDGKWAGHRVAIVPKATGAHLERKLPKSFGGDRAKGKIPKLAGGEFLPIGPPAKIITATEAQDRVRKAVADSKLHLREPWAYHLGKGDFSAMPRPGEPVLVHHADAPDRAYYIVPLIGSRVAATVHAETGRVLEFGLFPKIPTYKPWCPKAAQRAIKKAAQAQGIPITKPSTEELHPGLVWKRRGLVYSKFAPLWAFRQEDQIWGVNPAGHLRKLS
jgi:hypothetical protein